MPKTPESGVLRTDFAGGALRASIRDVDVTAELLAPCRPEELFVWVGDLNRYPDWLDMVPRAVRAEPHPDDPGPAWSVDLLGQLGPFARSKRLRMVRTVYEQDRSARFERMEHDGRDHSAWVLQAVIAPQEPGGEDASTLLTMSMHYGGALGGAVLEKLLSDEIEKSRPRLLERVAGSASAT